MLARTWKLATVLFLSVVLLGTPGVWAAEKAKVRAGIHDGYARIAFDIETKVNYEARIQGQNLIVRFERPIAAQLSPVTRYLKAYVGGTTISEDGRVFTFALLKPFVLRARTFDNILALDLVAKPETGKTRAKPVRVRVGEHPGFSRLVFDWSRPVNYRVNRKAGNLIVEFGSKAEIDIGRLTKDPPPNISSAKSWIREGRRVVDVRIPPKARVRHFRDGTNVVVDVIHSSDLKGRKSAAAPGRGGSPTREKAAKPTGTPAAAKPRSIVPRSLLSSFDSAAPNAKAPTKSAVSKPRKLAPSKSGSEKESHGGAAKQRKVATGPSHLTLKVQKTRGGLRLEFPWSTQTPAAVAYRAGYLWVVFGRPAEVNFDRLKLGVSGILSSAEQLPNDRATVLRFGLQKGLVPVVGRTETVWSIDLKARREPILSGAIKVRPEPSATTGPRVFLAVNAPGRPVTVKDPEVGDHLLIVPIPETARGVVEERTFVEFDVLASVQGIAVAPHADGVEMISQTNGVAVIMPGGLSLSRAPLEGGLYASGANAQASTSPGNRYLFDYPKWRHEEDGDFTEEKQKLQNAVSEAPPASRNVARLDLARFYFAHGFDAETLAVLDRIASKDVSVLADPAFLALRGAARVLSYRLPKGEKDLSHQILAGKPEINLWRGLAAARMLDWQKAREQFAAGVSALRAFPADVRSRFQLAWAESAIKAGDPRTAKAQVELAEKTATDEHDLLFAKFLAARVDEETEQFGKALEKYQEVIDAGYRPTRARAEAGRIRVQLEQGTLTRPEAIEAYEKLRYAWRGDEFELQLLQTLGRLYNEEGDFREGLEIMRQAVTYYPKSQMATGTAQAMSEEFARLFLDGDADSLPPVKALGLYYDFRELTPVGERGDMMISKLADRLVSVDLLDQAAQLLKHQVDFRLKGPEKSKVATRLAVIQLLNRKPEEALRALRDSPSKDLSPKLAAERVRLEARALTELDRLAEAIDVLQDSDEPEAEELRADIYWRWKKWNKAASSFATLLGERWKQDKPLDERSRFHVMQQAVSLSLANDRGGLDALREHYQPFFKGTSEEKSFQVITSRVNREGADFRELASTIAQVGQLEAFMASYREKLRTGQLSAIN